MAIGWSALILFCGLLQELPEVQSGRFGGLLAGGIYVVIIVVAGSILLRLYREFREYRGM